MIVAVIMAVIMSVAVIVVMAVAMRARVVVVFFAARLGLRRPMRLTGIGKTSARSANRTSGRCRG